nr:hypothetical protein [Tanacetum cinerariifolium]
MHADLKYVESLEKEIDELESDKAEFSNMYDEILQECVSKDVMCFYLQSLSDLDALAELQYLKAQMQDKNIAISELKKLIKQGKGKSVDTKFDRPYVVRQPNAQQILEPSVLVTAQTLPQTVKKAISNTNVLKPGILEPETNRFNVEDSSSESNQTPSKEDLDNLFSPMYEEYFEKRFSEVSTSFAAPTTLHNDDPPSSSSIIIEETTTPPLVSFVQEQISLVLNDVANESF